jgi:hypothetical protein
VVEWILVILFAYGVHGLSRCCLETPTAVVRGLSSHLKAWWAKSSPPDKWWARGSVIALGVGVLGWLIYGGSRDRLVAYLQEVDFEAAMAGAIASFSIRQVGWFVLFLALAVGLVSLVLSGYFNGRRARIGSVLLGVLLVVDLGLANVPWVVTWDWVKKYASNPVIDLLREKAYEHRVAVLPFNAPPQLAMFSHLYDIEWKQQLFPYNNIQCMDWIMNPRPREDERAFETALFFNGTSNTINRVTRRWQLTNTRYLLGAAAFLPVLNQELDPVQQRFRIATRFHLRGKPGIAEPRTFEDLTAVIAPEGEYAVFDFTGALPRTRLYANWQVITNDQETLKLLPSPSWNPDQTVLVADAIPSPSASNATNQNAGTVEFASYAPKDVVLKANALMPSVLLLNNRFDPDWKVSVDGKPERLLRCNYLMRGVYLQPGSHTVEFRYAPPVNTLYVSLAAVLVAVFLLGYLAYTRERVPETPAPRTPSAAK